MGARRAHADGTRPRKVWTAPGPVFWPAWFPDGRRLRATAIDRVDGTGRLWEVGADGGAPRVLLPGFPHSTCPGSPCG